ncbi:MAG: flagellar protein FlgN, partial [Bacillota bacterium]|nr:flagellar protein FlgN [Bacillota bacterium]
MDALNNMVGVLREEVEIYRDLMMLVEKTNQALVKHNLEELNKMLDSQQLLLVQAGKFEERRQQHQQELAASLGMPAKELTLTKLIEQVPKEKAEQLKVLQNDLVAFVDKINATNKQNEELIKDSLKYIDYTMQLFTGGEDSKTYHKKPGNTEGGKQGHSSRIFDRKV